MNATVLRLTARGLLGKRRAALMALLPVLLLALAIAIRLSTGVDQTIADDVLSGFAMVTMVPLLAVIAGTGVLGPEIDDGSVVYLLAKPIGRPAVVASKLAVAVATVTAFGALPTLVAGLILAGTAGGLAVGYALGALVAGAAYCALFLLLSVLTRNAVIVGLLYAVVWEAVVGGFVPGAQTLSILQWSLAVTRAVVGEPVTSAVSLPVGATLLVLLFAGATWFAGQRLRSLTLTSEE